MIFVVNLLINFILSPFIVQNLGAEANGFVQLANTFVSYVSIITIALNSMASRFITVSLVKGEKQRANQFYSSTFFGNVILLGVLIIPIAVMIYNLQHFVNISPSLVGQVKYLFSLIFISFFLSTAAPVWTVATFVKNKIYLQSIGTMLSTLTRAIAIGLLFMAFKPKIWYLGIAAILSTLILQIWQFYCKTKELNELKVKIEDVKWENIKELLASGIWNSVNQLGILLFGGLDLIFSNLFINAKAMGIVSIAQIVPNFLGSLQSTITNIFTPNMTIFYAKGKIEALKNEIFKAGKINIALLGIPFTILVVFGQEFFHLWMPSQNSVLLQQLSVLYTLSFLLMVGIMPLWSIFVIVNKTRTNSDTVIISGVISAILTLAALKFTNLGVLAICGVSSIVAIFRNIIFVVPYSAKYIGLKWTTFFPLIFLTIFNFVVEFTLGKVLLHFMTVDSWLSLATAVIIFGLLSIVLSFVILLNRKEKAYFFNFLKKNK
ncbi:hypothetical protein RT41_GL001408 [Lactococcus fujiensis JCM 16395]|uniref:Uncharacterized protein n=1 Tax=Lactococcus fujiensis JCM 16395 TaxID=1291764 RepID=A0A2A5RLE5_9LACT|nr:hypothetical protein RT41_GL001408 [Lactococcus fujiensis JCM 16395]